MKNPILILALVLATIVQTLSATPPEFLVPDMQDAKKLPDNWRLVTNSFGVKELHTKTSVYILHEISDLSDRRIGNSDDHSEYKFVFVPSNEELPAPTPGEYAAMPPEAILPVFPAPGPIIVQNTDGSHSLVVNGTHYKLASPPLGVDMPAPPPEGGSYPFELFLPPESSRQLNTNTTVFIFSTTNAALPLASWPLLTTVIGTVTNLTMTRPNQEEYFTGYESNKLGVGEYFFVESKPLLPGNRALGIRKGKATP